MYADYSLAELGLDDDEGAVNHLVPVDEDDEEARALRQRLAKKRRVAGDTLDALARDPEIGRAHV